MEYEHPVVVIFSMWGQECKTNQFPTEAEALRWLGICNDKGWLLPESVVTLHGVVLWEGQDLIRKVSGE